MGIILPIDSYSSRWLKPPTSVYIYIYVYTHEYTNLQFVSGHPKAQMPRISDGQAKISEAVTKRPLVEWALGLGGQGILYIMYIYIYF